MPAFDAELEIRDVAPGLWLWRQRHWEWKEGDDWEPRVSSFAVESGGEVILLDPLAPPPWERAFWERIAAKPATAIVVMKPDHVRDVDLFARWTGATARGPWLYWKGDAPRTELEPVFVDEVLPGGLVALHDGRGGLERPLWLPEQQAIVFADGMAAMDGTLRIWWTPVLEKRTKPALREMLELPFEHVLVSHGEPVHTRADFERALEIEAWSIPEDA